MRNTIRPAAALGALLITAAPAWAAETTVTAGWMSEYIFRGIPQSDSSAMLSADIENDGWFAGAWAADVGQGSEVDLYAGYSGESNGWNYTIGGTGYFYTDDFDDDYLELNLGLGRGAFSLEAAFGEYDNFAGPTQDYSFFALTATQNGLYGTVGTFSRDFDGEYLEIGYGGEWQGIDVNVAAIHSTDDILGNTNGDDDTSIVLTVSKTFDISKK